ncbi:SDR family oxidoreductase [Herbiconiux sp. UC225_62]|uniref:SDR family oxidoreductase n=1 Tax=Herbiconiux sp. UC225_62 TaxID=3350168 RepID=UPI0036D2D97B
MARIIVIGGAGHVGSRVVEKLTAHGHGAIAVSRRTGVDSVSGAGLKEALTGADVVVDVTQSPSFAPADLLEFFTTSSTNIAAAAKAAGVGHHVVFTVVGTDRPQDIAYFAAKAAQEKAVRESGVPFSIVHSTQLFEFIASIVFTSTHDDVVRVSDALIQPYALDEAAAAIGRTAAGRPLNADIELAGPEVFPLDELIRRTFAAQGDQRAVVTDPAAPYFGGHLEQRTLLPAGGAQLGETRLDDWLPSGRRAA